jgi:hypothetical protein
MVTVPNVLIIVISILISAVGYFANRLIASIDRLDASVNNLNIANAVKDVDLNEIKTRLSDVEMVVDAHELKINNININCKVYEHDKKINH